MTSRPLAGIRVLDLSRVLAGPHCTMILGDLGADVIKVERPGTGDDTRGWGPPFDDSGRSAYFLSTNRNRLSLAADFSDPADLALVRALVADADVVVDNYLPGILTRYGIDKVAELSENSRLIWCTISGFGEGSRRPGYDFVVQAESGWMAITGPEEGPPVKTGVALCDVIAGKDAAAAILAALVGRERRSPTQRSIQISLMGSALAALVNVAQNTLVSGNEARRWGNAHANLVPYQLFEAEDRPFVIAVGSDGQWKAVARTLELDELADDPGLVTNAGRLASRERVVGAIAERVRSRPAAYWMGLLDAAGVPCGLVRTVTEALAGTGASAESGVPSAVGGSVRLPPPDLDAHGALIRKHHWSAVSHVPTL